MSEKKQLRIGDKIKIKNNLVGVRFVEVVRLTKIHAICEHTTNKNYQYKFKLHYDDFWGVRPVGQTPWDTNEYSVIEKK